MKYSFLGEKCLVRTYSAGVFYGEIVDKEGMKVILKDSRQLYRYSCEQRISLSGLAKYGIEDSKSKVCAPVAVREVVAIEILEVTEKAKKSIEEAPIVKQEE